MNTETVLSHYVTNSFPRTMTSIKIGIMNREWNQVKTQNATRNKEQGNVSPFTGAPAAGHQPYPRRKTPIRLSWIPCSQQVIGRCFFFFFQPQEAQETTQVRNKFSSLTVLNRLASQLFSKVFLQVSTLQGVCGETGMWANTTNHPACSSRQLLSSLAERPNRQLDFWKREYIILSGKTHCSSEINNWNLVNRSHLHAVLGKGEKGLELCW